jgi:molybdopterin-guanine dinucleotide biosynthesis protein A
MSTPSPTGYVLAGGLSRRLGRDKALLPWQKTTLLDHVTQLLGTVCHEVYIVGRHQTALPSKESCREPAGWLPDRTSGLGPVGGISTALHASQAEENIVVAVDLPSLTSEFLKYFKERCLYTLRPLTVCKIESAFPLCLGIRTSFVRVVDEYIAAGHRSIHGLIEGSDSELISLQDLVDVGFSAAIFTNINSESDYQAALKNYKP